jgi:hypothetical protein
MLRVSFARLLAACLVVLWSSTPVARASYDLNSLKRTAELEERLPGWQGEVPRSGPEAEAAGGGVGGVVSTRPDAYGDSPAGAEARKDHARGTWVEPISWHPRAFHLHNIMTDAECDEVLELARTRVRRSTVVDSTTGESKVDPIRTSEQCFLNRGHFPIVSVIEKRLERYTMLPWYNGEDLQARPSRVRTRADRAIDRLVVVRSRRRRRVDEKNDSIDPRVDIPRVRPSTLLTGQRLRARFVSQVLKYSNGQKYDAHHDVGELDTASGKQLAAEGGHRVATVLLYLSDVDDDGGGETAFPDSEWIDPTADRGSGWSECAEDHVAVKPKKGDGLLFWSITPEGVIDQQSMHAGCPVLGKSVKVPTIHWFPYDPVGVVNADP